MTIVAFASQHGGVATTTSALAIAHALAMQGHQTLLLDLHLQGQCGSGLKLEVAQSAYDWLVGQQSALSVTISNNGLRLLRGDDPTEQVNTYYYNLPNGRARLADKIREVAADEWVIIDTPRRFFLAEAVIAVADIIVIPFRGDRASMDGVFATKAKIEELKSKAEVILLPTLIDVRQRLTREILDDARSRFGDEVALPIPQRIAVAESQSYGMTIWDYRADGIEDVRAAYSAFLDRLLSTGGTTSMTPELLAYQQQVAELQAQLAEANTWRVQHDIQGRMDALEARLGSLESMIAETSRVASTLTERWEKLRLLFDDNPNGQP